MQAHKIKDEDMPISTKKEKDEDMTWSKLRDQKATLNHKSN